MPAAAADRKGHMPLVRGRPERLPFPDESFDPLTFPYLLRSADTPAAVMRELARVVRPGGRIAALDFGVPPNPLVRALWRFYTRMGLPLIGRAISERWASVGAFLRGSIERFNAAHSQADVERYWRDAGFIDVQIERMSFGAGVIVTGVKDGATEGPRATGSRPRRPGGPRRVERGSVAPSGMQPSVAPPTVYAAFYALQPGGLRDYWTLLHPPYTLWHLSYVLLGAALAPMPGPRIVAGALLPFFFPLRVAPPPLHQLRGPPPRTCIPSPSPVPPGPLRLRAGGAPA